MVAPGIEEVQASSRHDLHPHLPQGPPDHPPVVHHHPDMPVIVGRAVLALGERDELVSGVYERHLGSASPQLDVEEASVELQRLLYIPDLEGDVVEPDELRAIRHVPIIHAWRSLRHMYPAQRFSPRESASEASAESGAVASSARSVLLCRRSISRSAILLRKARIIPIPMKMSPMVKTLLMAVVGVSSPYPTVVSVVTLKNSESRMLHPSACL